MITLFGKIHILKINLIRPKILYILIKCDVKEKYQILKIYLQINKKY